MIIVLLEVAIIIFWLVPGFIATNKVMQTKEMRAPQRFFLICLSWILPLAGPFYAYITCMQKANDKA